MEDEFRKKSREVHKWLWEHKYSQIYKKKNEEIKKSLDDYGGNIK